LKIFFVSDIHRLDASSGPPPVPLPLTPPQVSKSARFR
jgi:hypothetical protein